MLVVDNARPTARARGSARRPVHGSERSPTNTGGAGGFHDGLAWAVERGADLVWLMDDDGLPDPDCLGQAARAPGPRLLGAGGRRRGRPGPAGLPDPAARRHPGRARDGRGPRAAATDGVIRDVVIPFNGVLVTRDLVERIGLPRAEFFIWGDDVEYLWRANEAGARTATVVDAAVRHPSVGRPRHPDDVRPDDVQPQPERPQALLHGAQQHGQPAHLPGLAARADVLDQDACGSTCSPGPGRAGSR